MIIAFNYIYVFLLINRAHSINFDCLQYSKRSTYKHDYFKNEQKHCCLKQNAYDSRMTCFKTLNLSFTMGTNVPIFKNDGEAPARRVYLKPFCIDKTEVSNWQFLNFVRSTGYASDAEKNGDSFGFAPISSDFVRNSSGKAVGVFFIKK